MATQDPLTPGPTTHPTGARRLGQNDEMLLALTALVSRWNSHDFQRTVATASGIDLDPTAVRALYFLGKEGGTATPSTVATELHLSRPSTSKLLARLSEAGLLQREVQVRDRRSVSVSLTPLGRTTYEELFDAGLAMIDAATLDWLPADRAALTRLLPRFLNSLTIPPPQ